MTKKINKKALYNCNHTLPIVLGIEKGAKDGNGLLVSDSFLFRREGEDHGVY